MGNEGAPCNIRVTLAALCSVPSWFLLLLQTRLRELPSLSCTYETNVHISGRDYTPAPQLANYGNHGTEAAKLPVYRDLGAIPKRLWLTAVVGTWHLAFALGKCNQPGGYMKTFAICEFGTRLTI